MSVVNVTRQFHNVSESPPYLRLATEQVWAYWKQEPRNHVNPNWTFLRISFSNSFDLWDEIGSYLLIFSYFGFFNNVSNWVVIFFHFYEVRTGYKLFIKANKEYEHMTEWYLSEVDNGSSIPKDSLPMGVNRGKDSVSLFRVNIRLQPVASVT